MRPIILLLATLCADYAFGQTPAPVSAPNYGASFAEIKTYQEQALKLGGTKAQLQQVQRNILMSGYGRSGYAQMFRGYSPNPAIEGIPKTVRLATSDNANLAAGSKRTLLYEKLFAQGKYFDVIATDKGIQTALGRTDIDLVLKHRKTGKGVFVEVKNEKLEGQSMGRYKEKILRISNHAKTQGGQAILVNRYGIKPEIQEFAARHEVTTYENVATGKLSGQKAGNIPFREIERDLSKRVLLTKREPSNRPHLSNPHSRTHYADGRSFRSSQLVKSGGIRWQNAGKWAGRGGIIVIVAVEGYVIHQFATGRLSEREFVTAQSAIVAGGSGALGGAKAGAAIGLLGGKFAPITVPAGWLIGGLAGGFGGAKLGQIAASGYYARLDSNQKREIEAFISERYAVSR